MLKMSRADVIGCV